MRRAEVVLLVMVLCALMMTPVSAAVTDTPPAAVYPCQDYTFMIDGSGSIWAWGSNNNGQMGDGTYIDRFIPVLLKNYADLFGGNLTGVSELKGGLGYTVALKDDGTVMAAGANGAGQLGKPGRADPAVFSQVPNVSVVSKMAAGDAHVLVLKGDGTVWSWGDNSYGQLGNNSSAAIGEPARVQGISGIRAIAAGGRHSVATYGMETYAWGDNLFGQLGDGTRNSSKKPVKVRISSVTALAAGEYHTLALLDDGTIWAWGGNEYGQLGNEVRNSSNVPVRAGSLRNIKAIAASDRYSLALKYDGTVWAWGYNGNGNLGNGQADTARHTEPVQVAGLYDITDIYATPTGCMAKDIYGNYWVWGDNSYGQLGDGTRTNHYSPVPWYPSMAPWWSATTPTPKPATPTPTPAPSPTPTPAPAPGIAIVAAAFLGAAYLLHRRS